MEELFVIMPYNKDVFKYWREGTDSWEDISVATRFLKDQGIREVGRLLVEKDICTKLVPLNKIPRAKNPEPPSNDFIIICDVNGDPQNCYSGGVPVKDISKLVKDHDAANPNNAPHAAWQKDVGGFKKIFC